MLQESSWLLRVMPAGWDDIEWKVLSNICRRSQMELLWMDITIVHASSRSGSEWGVELVV